MAKKNELEALQDQIKLANEMKAEAEAKLASIGPYSGAKLRRLREQANLSRLDMNAAIPAASIAQIEQKTDLRLSTLRRFIIALGGSLEVIAYVNGHKVMLEEAGEVTPVKSAEPKRRGRKPGSKNKSAKAASTEPRKKPGPKPGSKRKPREAEAKSEPNGIADSDDAQ